VEDVPDAAVSPMMNVVRMPIRRPSARVLLGDAVIRIGEREGQSVLCENRW
jgi:hypothetical protein